jgi:pimeloyl-ACP methyl ester carboxylesterase
MIGIALVALAAFSGPLVPATSFQESIVGTWTGTLEGLPLRLVFHVSSGEDGGLTTLIDSPDQGATGIPTGSTTFEGGKLVVTVPDLGARYEGTLLDDGAIEGSWSQSGQAIRLRISRTAGLPAQEPQRPQQPTPPFPYQSLEVEYPNPRGGNRLAGTLTLPSGDGPFPAVVLISGSGAEDRDETVFGHKPFAVIADHFTRSGIAVLRFDDRGVGGSTGNHASATSADFATDVAAGVDYLLDRPEVDRSRIGLVGHSEGGLIAPMVATEREDVAFLVLMAGPGTTGERILLDQGELIVRASGLGEAAVEQQRSVQIGLFQAIRSLSGTELEARVREIMEPELAGASQEQMDAAIRRQAAMLDSPWLRFFLDYDPAPALRRIAIPVLAVNGELDLQVPHEANLAGIKRALTEGGNTDVTVRAFPGLNHLFQTATTGHPNEYTSIEETVAPVVLETMTEWILGRFGR